MLAVRQRWVEINVLPVIRRRGMVDRAGLYNKKVKINNRLNFFN